MLFSCTGTQKKDIAENNFCKDLTSFLKSLEALDEANAGTDVDAFNKAFDKADKKWNKLEESAAKLEDVQINESVNAYNKMVDKINKILNSSKTDDATAEINQHIDATLEKINYLLSTSCE